MRQSESERQRGERTLPGAQPGQSPLVGSCPTPVSAGTVWWELGLGRGWGNSGRGGRGAAASSTELHFCLAEHHPVMPAERSAMHSGAPRTHLTAHQPSANAPNPAQPSVPPCLLSLRQHSRAKGRLCCCAKRGTLTLPAPVGSPQPQPHPTAPPPFPSMSPRVSSGVVFLPYPIQHGCATPHHPGKAPFSPPSAAPSSHPAPAAH